MVGSGLIAEASEAELVRLMVGRPIDQVFPKRDIAIGETVLEVENLSNSTEFADISLACAAARFSASTVSSAPVGRRPPNACSA